MENKPTDTNEAESLETTTADATDDSSLESSSKEEPKTTDDANVKKKVSLGRRLVGAITHANLYLLVFVLIIVLSAGIVFVAYQRNKKESAPTTVTTTTLDSSTLNQLNSSDATVGDPKQTLTIESNAIFSGKVLVRDSLDVAGSLKVGGNLSLPGLAVSGAATFDQIQANTLVITGNASIQGQLSLQKGITSTGGATFGGTVSAPQLNVGSLQLSGDLQIVRHIDAGGATPGKADGTALGSGGTVSVSGTDTAGTVTINTGGSPGVGCFVTVSFTNKFSGTPHVIITPVGSAAAALNYYTSRTSSSFTICSTNAAPAGQTFSFDFIALD